MGATFAFSMTSFASFEAHIFKGSSIFYTLGPPLLLPIIKCDNSLVTLQAIIPVYYNPAEADVEEVLINSSTIL
jgi:hypothetical protein